MDLVSSNFLCVLFSELEFILNTWMAVRDLYFGVSVLGNGLRSTILSYTCMSLSRYLSGTLRVQGIHVTT